ncbi:MAG: hypothetical protein U0835_12290 [Isosphaeraceae bacterium]
MFGFGRDEVGAFGQTVNNKIYGLAPERPFHSLSYPDIDYTIMRPAALPPSTLTNPVATGMPTYVSPGGTPAGYANDPGVKNPYLYTRSN